MVLDRIRRRNWRFILKKDSPVEGKVVKLRISLTLCLVTLLTIYIISPASQTCYSSIITSPEQNHLPLNPASPDDGNISLTWTSRWSPNPQEVHDDLEIVGDHIVLNATFNDELNITRTDIELLDGFRFFSNQRLSNFTIVGFPYSFDPDDFSWVHIDGLRHGMPLNITCNFTNSDSDFFGWPSDFPMDEREFYNNIFDYSMATNKTPEKVSMIWDSECTSLDIAAYNYGGTPGNWSVHVIAGWITNISSSGSTAIANLLFLSETSLRFLEEGHNRWVWGAYQNIYQGKQGLRSLAFLESYSSYFPQKINGVQ